MRNGLSARWRISFILSWWDGKINKDGMNPIGKETPCGEEVKKDGTVQKRKCVVV